MPCHLCQHLTLEVTWNSTIYWTVRVVDVDRSHDAYVLLCSGGRPTPNYTTHLAGAVPSPSHIPISAPLSGGDFEQLHHDGVLSRIPSVPVSSLKSIPPLPPFMAEQQQQPPSRGTKRTAMDVLSDSSRPRQQQRTAGEGSESPAASSKKNVTRSAKQKQEEAELKEMTRQVHIVLLGVRSLTRSVSCFSRNRWILLG